MTPTILEILVALILLYVAFRIGLLIAPSIKKSLKKLPQELDDEGETTLIEVEKRKHNDKDGGFDA